MMDSDGPGAVPLEDGRTVFRVWAPRAERVELLLVEPERRVVPLEREDRGYHAAVVSDVEAGALYMYRLDAGLERPDPASRHQPRGVHGPSRLVSPDFEWSDDGWSGIAPFDHVFYEIHVGTYTEAGTFDAVADHLDSLVELGVTTVELMPVAAFPGARGWGYDGVYPWAVHDAYGGPDGLKRLVDACHRAGLAVALDVVYNHLGPEGNYLSDFGPYFTDRYRTPWGRAVNVDGPGSDEVRRYFIDNALYWVTEFHIDALRLDAVHEIHDNTAIHFLEQLSAAVHERAERLGRRIQLIGESDANDPRMIRPREAGGYGLDGQWLDDYHHALHTLLTGETPGYYQDYGSPRDLAAALRDGFVLAGRHSGYRGRRHGRAADGVPARCFVVYAQNHDQVGNRPNGERLGRLVPFESLKLAAAAVLLSPYLPLLFMGEEWDEPSPFPYFTSHGEAELVAAVRRGRAEELSAFGWTGDPPDPQAEETFRSARIHHELRREGRHGTLFEWHRCLLAERRALDLGRLGRTAMEVTSRSAQQLMLIRYGVGPAISAGGEPASVGTAADDRPQAAVLLHFGTDRTGTTLALPGSDWRKRLDSADERWAGPGSAVPDRLDRSGAELELAPRSAVLFVREG